MDHASNLTMKHVIKQLKEILEYDKELKGYENNTLTEVIFILEDLRSETNEQ